MMKQYSSFLVRCWVIREEGVAEQVVPERIVFDVEHIQKGEHWRALTPEAALEQIMQVSQQATRKNEADIED